MTVDRRQDIAAILREVARLARELTAARSGPFGARRLTRSQLDALFVLAHSARPVTSRDLADALSLTPGAVTQLLAGLREAGLVETTTPDSDARVRIVGLSAPARAQVDEFEGDAVARMAPAFDGLDDEKLRTLAALLAERGSRP